MSSGRGVPAPTRRWRGPVVLVILLSLALGACGGVIGSFVSTTEALRNAGYGNVNVGLSGQDDVKVSASIDQAASTAEVEEVAAIVWRDFHQRFDALQITLHASDRTVTADSTFAYLQSRLGARNPAYNRTSVHSGIIRIGIAVIVGVVVIILLVVGLVLFLVRRRRRRRGLPSAPWGGPGGPGGQWQAGQWVGAPAGPWGVQGYPGAPQPGAPQPGAPQPGGQAPWNPPPGGPPSAPPGQWGTPAPGSDDPRTPAPGSDDPRRPPPAW